MAHIAHSCFRKPFFMNSEHLSLLRKSSKLANDKYKMQLQYMDVDECLVVNTHDTVLSTASKRECHQKGGLLHRAFSLFIFRKTPRSLELLMQQRAASKITFPLLWTNSCCSHPLINYEGESDENNALGVKRAAIRKVKQELGIDITKFLSIDDIHFLTRVIYSALNEPEDGIWCEREIDYLLVSILPSHSPADYSMSPNPDEVAAVDWCDLASLESSVNTSLSSYTPWFRKLALSGLLRRMWDWADSKVASQPLPKSFQLMDNSWNRSNILTLE